MDLYRQWWGRLEAIFPIVQESAGWTDELSVSLIAPVDDKIEALVGLVLEAVDQRLTAVREQLVEVANTIARHHADLQMQIIECRELITIGHQPTRAASAAGQDDGANAHAAASIALLEAANVLTERVGSLESRLQQHTDQQIARLEEMLDQPMAPAVSAPAVSAPAVSAPTASAPTVSAPVVAPTASAPTVSAPVVSAVVAPVVAPVVVPEPIAVNGLSPAIAKLGSLRSVSPPAATPAATPTAMATATATADAAVDGFDIDAFSAQLNARLGALVEKAIGV